MTLSEYAEFVTRLVGKTDSISVRDCKAFVRMRYRMIYDSALWVDTLALVSRTAGDDELILDHRIDRVVAARWNEQSMFPTDHVFLLHVDPNIFERSGTPTGYTPLTSVATSVLPVSERITLVSSSGIDTATNILLRGELAGVEKTETLILGGTTPVSSVNSYDILYTLSKEATVGTVSVTGFTSALALVTLWAEEHERKHARIRLHEIPMDLTKSILILGKKRLRQLTNDLDTPIISGIDNAILLAVEGDMQKRQRQYAKAQFCYEEAAKVHMPIAYDLEKHQATKNHVIIPVGAWNDYEYDECCWMK